MDGRAMKLLQTGDEAPDFQLPSTDGQRVTLREHAGQPVVLYFYPRDNTPGCTWEARSFRAQFEVLVGEGVTIFGISQDNIDDHCEFQGRLGLPFELLSDEEGAVHDAYGAWKQTLLGRRVRRCTYVLGPDQRIAKVYPSVLPVGHAKTVARDVQALSQQHGWGQ